MLRLRTALDLGVRYLCLTRYSWLSALVLMALVPLSLDLMPRLLANLFVFDLPQQIFHVSWISIWCAATVMETLRTTTMNAHLRFDDYRIAAERFREAWGLEAVDEASAWYQSRAGWLLMFLGLAAAIGIWHGILHACIESTVQDPAATWNSYVDASDEAAMRAYCWKWAIAGLTTTLTLLVVLNGIMIFLHARRVRRGGVEQPELLRSLYACLNAFMGPGYFRTEPFSDSPATLRLAPGHFRLVLYTATFLAWYVVNYVTVTGNQRIPTESSDYVALFYAFLSLLLLMYVLTGFAFFWDRYRIPVPLLILGIVLVFFSSFGTDHYYDLNLAPEGGTPYDAPDLTEVFDGWKFPAGPDDKRTLVVVDASGGGIQAAAWTAQVLTGLHEVYGNDFSKSIGLISSVSGGSVGTMFYLANRTEVALSPDPALSLDEALTKDAIANIREAARSSALEATAWGLAYPDTLRTVFPFAVDETIDRGWAIEQVWQQRMKSTSVDGLDRSILTLVDLGMAIRQNQLPVPVFNATFMESGQRLQISPVLSPSNEASEHDHGEHGTSKKHTVVQLLDVCSEARPLVSTAARLSATFPYITPAARAMIPAGSKRDPRRKSAIEQFHVVDGGYVDNEGAVTSVDWINRLLAYYEDKNQEERPFDRVVLLRIQAFPTDTGTAAGQTPRSASGWRSALIGPLDAIMTVRSASQLERGDLELTLLTDISRIRTKAQQREAELKRALAVSGVKGNESGEDTALPERDIEANLSPAEMARQQAMSRDHTQQIESFEEQATQEFLAASDLEVVLVTIDFHSPDETIMTPMSWKLTARQKKNIDVAWTTLLDGKHPHKPLQILDDFFKRSASLPESLTESGGSHQSAPTL